MNRVSRLYPARHIIGHFGDEAIIALVLTTKFKTKKRKYTKINKNKLVLGEK